MKPHEIEAYIAEPHKKSGDLMAGYRVALNPETWEKEREAARMEAEEAEADEEVDELEGEEADDDDEARDFGKELFESGARPDCVELDRIKVEANEECLFV